MKRIVLGMLPALLTAQGAVTVKEFDPLDDLRCTPESKYIKPKEAWQGQGKRKRPRNK